MNKRFLFGMFFAVMAMAPWRGNAATQDIDTPHKNLVDGCAQCHFSDFSPGTCSRCHDLKTAAPPYANTNAPYAAAHKSMKCEACHNPHVSLQDGSAEPAYVTGNFGGKDPYNATTDRTTLTNVQVVTGPPSEGGKPDWRWAMKYGEIGTAGTYVGGKPAGIGKERGMILWVDNGVDDQNNPQRTSFEIKDIDVSNPSNYKVTVQGDATAIANGSFELRWGQLIAKAVTTDPAKSYATADPSKSALDHAVSFPPSASTSRYVDTVGTSATGICQVCHIGEKSNNRGPFTHWNASGTHKDHNADKDCEGCHPHASGFMASACRYCHNGVSEWGAPSMNGSASTGLVTAPPTSVTGSQVAGAHEIHVGGRGGKTTELFNCDVCHVGSGMNTSTPDVINHTDGLQIGFNTPGTTMGYKTQYKGQASVGMWNATTKKGYMGTNYTKVTTDGTPGNYTCSNVYCHTDGTSLRIGCKTAKANTTPSWDTPTMQESPAGSGTYVRIADADGTHCNDCHGYSNLFGNTLTTYRHASHVTQGKKCFYCHAATVDIDGNIIDKSKHINGVVDIKGGNGGTGTDTSLMNYDLNTHNCTNSCHGAAEKSTWLNATDLANIAAYVCPDPCTEADGTVGAAMTNTDPILAAEVKNLDPNTLSIADMSVDPDRIDPVKHQCQGGIGFDGTLGYVKYQVLDVGNNGPMGNFDIRAPLDGTKQPPAVRTYRNIPGFNGVDIQTDPANPRVYYQYTAVDSQKDSLSKATSAKTVSDGDGVITTGWATYVMQPVDLPHTNTHPIMDIVTPVTMVRQTPTTCLLTIMDKTVDPDRNDPAKQAYFGAGHNGGPGYAKINWATTGPTGMGTNGNWTAIPLDGTPTAVTAVANGVTGDLVWYQYYVEDNHRITNSDKTQSYIIQSGWKKIYLP